jgi:hypothetical protein
VKMPGRGFVFVRLSVAKEQTKDEQDTGETKEDEKTYEQRVSKSLGRAVSRAARLLTASVRAGAVPSPRWVEKVVAIQATCAMPEISETAAETDKAETASSVLRDTVKRVVACLDAEALKKSHTAGGSDDGKDDDGKGVLRFAVAFANRFRGMGGEPKNKTRDSSNSFKRYAREFVVPAVAAAAESALGTTKISLTDPDVCFFVEVLSVPNEGADGSRAGGYVERLAIGAAARRDGVFELKRGAIRPVALKRASEATG